MSDALPVRWLCGPSGVGKSTVGWQLYTGLPGAGHVDIDQLGMCFPTIPADPGRTILQARILDRIVTAFRAAGATCLVVSGYVDARHGVRTAYLAHAALDVLRLRCSPPELRRRLKQRARAGEHRDDVLRDAEVMDRSGFPYPCLDTSELTAAEVLAAVRRRWPTPPARRPGPWPDPVSTPGEILWLCGTTAVGKSTVGWDVAQSSLRAGHMTGFVDLQQLGFLHPPSTRDPGNHRLKAANLAALWAEFHAYGAQRLVVVGAVDSPAELRLYADALAAATLTLVRLDAGPGRLRERIRLRGSGGGPPIAGDELRGQPAAVLDRAYRAAVVRADALRHTGIGDLHLATDSRTVDELASEVADRIGW